MTESNKVSRYVVLALISSNPKYYFGCKIIREGDVFPMIYRVVNGPASYWECSEWMGFNCKPIAPWWTEEEELAARRTEAAAADRSALPSLYETRKIEIGHVDGIPEVKVEWEGGLIKYPVIYHRTSKLTAYAEFAGPNLDGILGDITSCAVGAAAAATLAAILASPTAALPAFKAALLSCLIPKIGERAKEISVALSTQQVPGEWHRV